MIRVSPVVDPGPAPEAVSSDSGRGDSTPATGTDDCEALWSLCLAITEGRRRGLPSHDFTVDAGGCLSVAGPGTAAGAGEGNSSDVGDRAEGTKPLRLHRDASRGWELSGNWSAGARAMLDLYRPLLELESDDRYVLGHLGQSIDGRIATSSGDSCFINGQENLVHMHRLRALCDAVLVGAGTVVADDPQLTTRLVPGPNATRVVLDPSTRLTPAYRICSDNLCPTLIARFPEPAHQPASPSRGARSPAGTSCGCAEIIPAVAGAAGIDLADILAGLADRGLRVILVEGGGITVSRFLAQGLLDRLQIAIAPVIIGSGRQGLQLPEVLALSDCLRPSYRHHTMGSDVLWDLDLQAAPAGAPAGG